MADLAEDFAGDAWTITNDADNFGFGVGYLVENHSGTAGSHTLAQINKFLSDPDIAIWAHAGHGDESSTPRGGLSLDYNGKVDNSTIMQIKLTNHYSANKFVPHHKIGNGYFLDMLRWATAMETKYCKQQWHSVGR